PEFADLQVMRVADGEGEAQMEALQRQPTMRELLNHTAGFGYGLAGDDPVNTAFREKGVLISSDLSELAAKVATIPLLSQPGEQWSYCIAVDLQADIVGRLSGQSFGDLLEQRLFAPLGRSDTGFYGKEEDRERFAEGHTWDAEQGKLVQRAPRT